MAMLVLKKVVTDRREVEKSTEGRGPTIGQLVDEMLVEAAMDGQVVQEVSFHIEEQDWHDMAAVIRVEQRGEATDWPPGVESWAGSAPKAKRAR